MAYKLVKSSIRQTLNYKGRTYEMVQCTGDSDDFYQALFRGDRALCLAPPKAQTPDEFKPRCPFKECIVEEYIDGILINIYYDGEWDIMTRESIGGNVIPRHVYEKTVRVLFFEVCKTVGLDIEVLDKQKCYSFIIRNSQQLFLVACHQIDEENVAKCVDSYGEFKDTDVRRPEQLDVGSYADLEKNFASYNCDSISAGVMVHHIPTNDAAFFRNPMYDAIQTLRNIPINIQYYYFSLRAQHKESEYLENNPEYTSKFEFLGTLVNGFIGQLHHNYLDCYARKLQPLEFFPVQYRVHMVALHKLYLKSFSSLPRKKITLAVVREFVNTQHPAKIMYTITFPFHEMEKYV